MKKVEDVYLLKENELVKVVDMMLEQKMYVVRLFWVWVDLVMEFKIESGDYLFYFVVFGEEFLLDIEVVMVRRGQIVNYVVVVLCN